MEKKKPYVVVEFLNEDGAVDVLPSKWITGDEKEAYWPHNSFKGDVSKAIKDNLDPDPDVWTKLKIRILSEASTHVSAKQKAKAAEETSHLSALSSEEGNSQRKRRRNPKYVYSQSETDSENEETIKASKTHSTCTSTSTWKRMKPPTFPQRSNIPHPESVYETPSTRTPFESPFTRTPYESPYTRTAYESPSTRTPYESPSIRTSDPFLRQVFRALENISYELKELKKTVKQNGEQLKAQSGEKFPDTIANHVQDFECLLPLKSDDDLNTLECILNCVEERVALGQYLSMVGGEGVKDITYNILKKLISKAMAMKYSSCGRQKKKNFSSLHICDSVYRAVRVIHPPATDVQIRKRIGFYLATACDKEGGRKDRMAKGHQDEHL